MPARSKKLSPTKNKRRNDDPIEILAPMTGEESMPAQERHTTREDPAMRDGNSGRGNPYETDADEITTDNDVGDARVGGVAYGGPHGGAVGGTPAQKRATGGHLPDVDRKILHDTPPKQKKNKTMRKR